jgi:hypothetical protein
MKQLFYLPMVFLLTISAYSQDPSFKKTIMLPIISDGFDESSIQTAESILRMELSKEESIKLISERLTIDAIGDEDCIDEECARRIGKQLEAEQVLICKINPLGEKLIVQYQLIETATGNSILSERATATFVEDLDMVMKRVAISVARQTPFDSNQEVGNIVVQESVGSLRQEARYNFGVGFGYLFPSAGYDDDKDKSFTINGYFDYEMMDFSAGLMIGARKGFAMNVYGNYLFSKTDFSPYLGSSLGFHWVIHEGLFEDDGKDGDGIELGLIGGFRIFHTYNFQIFIQGEYIMTFNDYNDKAFVLTIGIL